MAYGFVNSIQTLGTLDGPGVRFVVFMQGCPLKCGYCHNPETQELSGGTKFSSDEIIEKAIRYKEYFGKDGGITVSGGEPLLQAEFVREVFAIARTEGIGTCLDTSGSILTDAAKAALEVTDRVLLDIKYTSDAEYRKYVGCSIDAPLAFLDCLDSMGIPTTVRQVIVPTVNDSTESIKELKNITRGRSSVDKIELLPFKKICSTKYENMGIPFPFADKPTPTKEDMERLNSVLKKG